MRLRGRGDTLRAECDCPAYDDTGFCKHIVAVALAANAAAGDAGPTPDAADGPMADLAAWLKAQPAEVLAALLLEQAAGNTDLAADLRIRAARALLPAQAEAGLRRAIDDQTRARALPAYRGVRAWANRLAETVAAIEDLAAADPDAAVRVADHALARIAEALRFVDDFDGYGLWLLEQAAEAHQTAVIARRPDPLALAAALFQREMDDGYELFHGAADAYADVLGLAGRSEYRRLAQAAWDALPPRGKGEPEPERERLLAILDRFAEADDDLAARLALRRRDLSNANSYRRLAEFCLDHGLAAEALAVARDGVWLHDRDERLRDLLVMLLLANDHRGEAVDHLWRSFERRPDFQLYRRLRDLDGAPAADRALAVLEDRLARGQSNDRFADPAHLLVRVLTEEGLHDRAWQLTRERGLDAYALARASGDPPARGRRHLHRRDRRLVGSGGNAGYQTAVTLLAGMAKLRTAQEQAAHVAALRDEFQRRRNFIALLDGMSLPGR